MKITARLALNQIKRNHHRTCGTVLAIVISTALLTATSCFVSSGNRMLQNFLGENYGTYGSAYKVLLLNKAGRLKPEPEEPQLYITAVNEEQFMSKINLDN